MGSFPFPLAVDVSVSSPRARVGVEYRKRCREGSDGFWDEGAWAWAMTKWPEKVVEAECKGTR